MEFSMGSSEQLSSLAHKKAVGGDVAPTANQDMETYEWNLPEVP